MSVSPSQSDTPSGDDAQPGADRETLARGSSPSRDANIINMLRGHFARARTRLTRQGNPAGNKRLAFIPPRQASCSSTVRKPNGQGDKVTLHRLMIYTVEVTAERPLAAN